MPLLTQTMDVNNPIGIFDSGIGGLTIAGAINDKLPNEQLIYFGDTQHLPYGDKSAKNIVHYCDKISDFLLERNCKAIVIACNTASATSYQFLKEKIGDKVAIINVIDPIISFIKKASYQSIGVIATPTTIQLATYQKKLEAIGKGLKITAKVAKSMASILEEGWHREPQLIDAVIEYYFSEKQFSDIDALILGCTHYPVIHQQIQAFRKDVSVIDAPSIVADFLSGILAKNGLLNQTDSSKKHLFYVSDLTEGFEKTAKTFFGEDINLEYYPLFVG